jgi:porin
MKHPQNYLLFSGALLTVAFWGGPTQAQNCQSDFVIHTIPCVSRVDPSGTEMRPDAKDEAVKQAPSQRPFARSASVTPSHPAVLTVVERPTTETLTALDSTALDLPNQAIDLLRPEAVTATALPELEQLSPAPEAAVAQENSDVSRDSVWERSQLTGDWGGLRTQLADSGVTFDLSFTQFLQGAAISSGSREFNYGGRFDAFINFNTEQLGLWEGGSFNTHWELRYGDVPDLPLEQGALWPVNTGAIIPLGGAGNLVASSLYLSQQFGDVNLLIGKINALDLLANDPFFGGWGTQRFMNISFVAPPSGVVPPVIFGAIANVSLNPVTLTFMAFDPNDQTNNYWPNNLFGDGVNLSAGATYATTVANRPTTFNLTGTYSTQTGADLNDLLLPPDVESGTRQGSYNISFQFTHLLHQNPDNPRNGWGAYLKAAIADGNPNPIETSVLAGIGGTGLFANRPQDRFGLGLFYWNFSNDLRNTVSPVINFGNEYGLEAYYSYAVTPWFYLTGDLQYVSPANRDFSDALFLGLRAGIQF